MNEDQRNDFVERFNKNVQWLKDVIPPEDIYQFAEQALMASDFFISELSDWVDIEEEAKRDKALSFWLKNIVGIRVLRDQGFQGKIDITIKHLDEV